MTVAVPGFVEKGLYGAVHRESRLLGIQRTTVGVQNLDDVIGRANHLLGILGGERQAGVLLHLFIDDVGRHHGERVQRLVVLVDEQPPMHHENDRDERTQRQQQQRRIPQGQTRADGKRHLSPRPVARHHESLIRGADIPAHAVSE